jgi:hypothetical protein
VTVSKSTTYYLTSAAERAFILTPAAVEIRKTTPLRPKRP